MFSGILQEKLLNFVTADFVRITHWIICHLFYDIISTDKSEEEAAAATTTKTLIWGLILQLHRCPMIKRVNFIHK